MKLGSVKNPSNPKSSDKYLNECLQKIFYLMEIIEGCPRCSKLVPQEPCVTEDDLIRG